MKNDANRWIAGISLLSLFAIIAYAGGRAAPKAQGTQNVLVTNTSSQPIPIAARPGTGAYIVAVSNTPSVKVASSPTAPVVTKDANNPDANGANYLNTLTMPPSNVGFGEPEVTLSANPIVIDEISCSSISSVAGEYINTAEVDVYDSSHSPLGYYTFAVPAVQNSGNTSSYLQTAHIPVPANGKFTFLGNRYGGATQGCYVQYSIAYHTVPNP